MFRGLFVGSIYGVIALGLALIWGIMNVCNFAQADYAFIGAFLAWWIFSFFGMNPLLTLPIVFLFVFALGIASHKALVEKIFKKGFGIQVFATFGLLLVLRYGNQVVWGSTTRNIPTHLTWVRVFEIFGVHIPVTQIIAIIIGIGSLIAVHLFLNRTWTGTAMLATCADRQVARLMGIDTSRIYLLSFGLGCAISAIGGLLIAINYPIYPSAGGPWCLIAFVVVILGGLGSLHGAFIGGIIIGVIEQLSAIWIPAALKRTVAYLVFLIVLMIKPSGLFEPLGVAYEKLSGK